MKCERCSNWPMRLGASYGAKIGDARDRILYADGGKAPDAGSQRKFVLAIIDRTHALMAMRVT